MIRTPFERMAKAVLNRIRRAKVARLGAQRSWRRVPRGFFMQVDPREGMDIGYYLDTYERALMRSIDLLVEPGDAAVDVGTHKGYVTLSLAKRVGVTGKVVSADPDQRVYLELVENCARNAFTHVSTFPIAVGESEGICEIAITSDLGNSSRFPNAIALAAVSSVVTVPMRRLDDVLEDEGVLGGSRPISFVKVDAEGSEPLILRGAERTLCARPAVYMEINNESLAAGGFSAAEIFSVFCRHGYSIYDVGWNVNLCGLGEISLRRLASPADAGEAFYEVLAVHQSSPRASRVTRFAGKRSA